MIASSPTAVRCGIILAGGDGKRLQPFVHGLRGSNLPKQYVSFVGTRSMLEHTLARAETLIPPERLFTVASRSHLEHADAREQLFKRSLDNLVLQPINRDTAPGVLLPLIRVIRRYPDATVALFPSDHFILEEDRFMSHVDAAFEIVEQDASRIVLLGIDPQQPEPEYGYMVPDNAPQRLGLTALRRVASFVEKPAVETALELVSRGALWNTMVLIFNAKTFLSVAALTTPDLSRSFQRIYQALGTPAEDLVIEDTYRTMAASNLSKDLLEPLASSYGFYLNVIAVNGVFWSDWGSESRILEGLRQIGYRDGVDLRHVLSSSAKPVSARELQSAADWGPA
jgi:mannose-1-phosphate guanylyltransferase